MAAEEYIQQYEAFVFELDDVLYPEKDFLLQVYYLFAQFMEYSAAQNAEELLQFMKQEFETAGGAGMFEKTAARFGIPEQYKLNFDLLNRNAKLPLKLLLFDEMMKFMQDLIVDRKQVFLLVSGNPEQQLNKIKQVEWNGLEQYLRVYFSDEIAEKPSAESLEYLVQTHALDKDQILVIGRSKVDQAMATNAGVKYLEADKLFGR
jgi:phosphoglycolate phosphatase-like HAD superfamily hydrolase